MYLDFCWGILKVESLNLVLNNMKAQILSELEDLWDVVEQEIWSTAVQPTNMQQLCNAIMSIWNELSEMYLH